MATTSLGSSTTQMVEASRLVSEQMRQVSAEATLKHTAQLGAAHQLGHRCHGPVDVELDGVELDPVEGLDDLDPEKFGKLQRGGKTLHRYRAREHRIYFERRPEGITVHRVLHKNTLQDFLFRSKLPLPEEDRELGKHGGFWELIEEGKRSGKA